MSKLSPPHAHFFEKSIYNPHTISIFFDKKKIKNINSVIVLVSVKLWLEPLDVLSYKTLIF